MTLDQTRDNPPEEKGWEPVLRLSASALTKIGGHWELNGEIAYNRVPDYNETAALAGVRFKF